jgi:multiple sugar transport system substrate-binding protein
VGSNSVQANYARTTGRLPILPAALDPHTTALSQKGLALVRQAHDLTQFYDRDTPPAMAAAGLDAMFTFWQHPNQLETVLHSLEKTRRHVFRD